jgi:Tol biopolymer transport system component/DNA-binding winged helix-turn-helix (wHTH) protein
MIRTPSAVYFADKENRSVPIDHSAANERPIYLDDFIFRPDLNRLLKGEHSIQLSPKASAVLLLLGTTPKKVFSRSEIITTVWSGRCPTDDVLTHAVTELRRALEDDPKNSRFIETIPRVGYRLICIPTPPATSKHLYFFNRPALAMTAVLCMLLAAWSWTEVSGESTERVSNPQTKPLMTISVGQPKPLSLGLADDSTARLSPRGHQVVFRRSTASGSDLFLRHVATGQEKPLVISDSFREGAPVWSPGGDAIAFRANNGEDCHIRMIDLDDQRVSTLASDCHRATDLDWSPDGLWIAFTAQANDPGVAPNLMNLAIFRLHADGTGRERLTFSETSTLHDINPRFSPDGQWLAFVRTGDRHSRQLMLQRIGETRARPVRTDSWITSLDWHPGGRHILMTAHRNELDQMEVIDLANGRIQALDLGQVGSVAVHPDGQYLVFQQMQADSNIWSMAGLGGTQTATLAIGGEGYEYDPALSPDGRFLAYTSTRSGMSELYIEDLTSGVSRRLTRRLGGAPSRARWSPDGLRIAFLVQNDKGSAAYIGDPHGDQFAPVSGIGQENLLDLSWSPDGYWLYYSSDRSGEWQIWRLPADDGAREQVTVTGGRLVQHDPISQSLYLVRGEEEAIYRMDLESRQTEVVLDGLSIGQPGHWSVTNEGLFFRQYDPAEGASVSFWNRHSQQVQRIGLLQGASGRFGNITSSSDGRQLFVDQLDDWQSDLYISGLQVAAR